MGLRVLVCGGRDYCDQARIYTALDRLHSERGVALIIEGGARGADRIARSWAQARGIPYKTFDAAWKRLGNAAGPVRNQQMLDEGGPDAVVAFPGGSGTADMVDRSIRAGLKVWHPGRARSPE